MVWTAIEGEFRLPRRQQEVHRDCRAAFSREREGISNMRRQPKNGSFPPTAVRPMKDGPQSVESECGAVAVGRTYLLPPLSSGGASLVRPWLRFHTPLIEPDMQISRIRLSDKTSRLFACNAICSV